MGATWSQPQLFFSGFLLCILLLACDDASPKPVEDEVETVEELGELDAELTPPSLVGLALNELDCERDGVELFNGSDAAIMLSGVVVAEKDFEEGRALHGELAPGAFLWLGEEELGFRLACGEERVTLFAPDGSVWEQSPVVLHASTLSLGRWPDGSGEWALTLATPGAANRLPASSGFLLNEVQCEGDDWVELVNASEEPLSLAGWRLADGDSSKGALLPAAELAGAERLLLERDAQDSFSFGLDCEGDVLRLYAPDGALVDDYLLSPTRREAASWSRLPDGGAWGLGTPTPAEPNTPYVDPSDALFDDGRVLAFDLELDSSAWVQLEQVPDAYVGATLTVEGAAPMLVGARIKGRWGSARTLAEKAAFKLKLDWVVPEQRFMGQKSLTLNNMVQDASMLHEWAAYRLMRAAGVAAPRVSWVWLRVNGEDFGLYANVESPDERFARRWFESSSHIYEGAYGQDLLSEHLWGYEVDLGSEGERGDLRALIALLESNEPAEQVSASAAYVDWAQLRRAMAAELFVGHWDGYAATRNNYRWHVDESGVFSLMPWGTDQCFSAQLGSFSGEGRLHQACMADASCRQALLQDFLAMVQVVKDEALRSELERVMLLIRPWVEADPRKEHGLEAFDEGYQQLLLFLAQREAELEALAECYATAPDEDQDGYRCEEECNDQDPLVYRGAPEICGDLIDQDCSGVADDDPSCGCILLERDSHRYWLCLEAMSFERAEQRCAAEGAQLLVIDDAEEELWCYEASQAIAAGMYWIGLSDREEEGHFVWSDGSEPGYLNWDVGEPNDAGGEDCVHFWGHGTMAWNDIRCETPMAAICEQR